MRLLFSKELRAVSAWVLAGIGLPAAIWALVAAKLIHQSWVNSWLEGFLPLACAVTAIGLAAAQVAGERHSRTLEFLLVRPIRPAAIIWTKFAAGSLALAVIVPAMVALGYMPLPETEPDTALKAIRELVSYRELTVTLLPRFWVLYALALLLSTLAARTRTAWVLAAVVAAEIATVGVIATGLAPFSRFVYGMPFIESSMGLVTAAATASIAAATGLACCAGALLIAAASANWLARSAERRLGTAACVAVVLATPAASLAVGRALKIPELRPVGTFQFAGDDSDAMLAADRATAAVVSAQSVQFLDFSNPRRPREISKVELPLWKTSNDTWQRRAPFEAGVVYLKGEKKALPVDEVEIAMVTAHGLSGEIPLGPVRPHESIATPVPAGQYVYVGIDRERVCSLLTYDAESKQPVAEIEIDRLPAVKGEESSPQVGLLRRGRYLYYSSPYALTTLDLADPAHPAITSRLTVKPKLRILYALPRPMAWQGDRLFDVRPFPMSLASYDAKDPAHPHAGPELVYHEGWDIESSGQSMYQIWKGGVLEFHAEGDQLREQRLLSGGGKEGVTAIAQTGDRLYTLTKADEHGRRTLEMYPVQSATTPAAAPPRD